MTENETWDDPILSNLTDADFELPNLDWVDVDDEYSNEEENHREVKHVCDEIFENNTLTSGIQGTQDTYREVLVTLDDERKKIMRLKEGEFDKIEEKLLASLKDDPVFKKSIRKSHIVFQEFNNKFNTWVDFDKSKEILDGAHLKVIFIRKDKEVERSSHRKHSHKEKDPRRSRLCDEDRKKSSSRKHESRKRPRLDYNEDIIDSSLLPHSSTDYDGREIDELCNSSVPNVTGYPESYTVFKKSTYMAKDQLHEECSIANRLAAISELSFPTSTTPNTGIISKKTMTLPRFSASEGELYYLSLAFKNKNPVTALHELCQKMKWGNPEFSVVESSEVVSNPHFLMKVTIRGDTFIPDAPSTKKKLAKNAAAECALKTLGILK